MKFLKYNIDSQLFKHLDILYFVYIYIYIYIYIVWGRWLSGTTKS